MLVLHYIKAHLLPEIDCNSYQQISFITQRHKTMRPVSKQKTGLNLGKISLPTVAPFECQHRHVKQWHVKTSKQCSFVISREEDETSKLLRVGGLLGTQQRTTPPQNSHACRWNQRGLDCISNILLRWNSRPQLTEQTRVPTGAIAGIQTPWSSESKGQHEKF